jgi:hypothetical protein
MNTQALKLMLRGRILPPAVLISALLIGACAQGSSPSVSSSPSPAAQSSPVGHAGHAGQDAAPGPTPRIPDYVEDMDRARPLPVTLDPAKFTNTHVRKAYQLARELPEVLAAQPCYCYCDAGFGHKSLLDCHIDDHSASCTVCLKEALLAGQMHRRGKTSAQIREAIVRGEWRAVELN